VAPGSLKKRRDVAGASGDPYGSGTAIPGLNRFLPAPWLAPSRSPPQPSAASGGAILTMAGAQPSTVEALVEQGGRITYVGPLAGAIRAAGAGARRVNLGGRTLLPGFIDTHGHFIYFGKNLIDADLFGAASIAEIVARMRQHAGKVVPGEWIVG
jgi:hypothetical protein